jgi:hypothetical protein
MEQGIIHVGLDVHKDTIAVALADREAGAAHALIERRGDCAGEHNAAHWPPLSTIVRRLRREPPARRTKDRPHRSRSSSPPLCRRSGRIAGGWVRGSSRPDLT